VSRSARVARSLELVRQALAAHDRESVTHVANGVGVSAADMRHLGFVDGEELWPCVRVHVDGGRSGRFRVLCSGRHGSGMDGAGSWEGGLP
jgi:hypothetical protein